MIPPLLISGTVAVFLCSISTSSSSTAFEPATVHSSHPNHCYYKETSTYHEDGDSWPINGCGMASCVKIMQSSGNPILMISYEGCGSVGYDAPCYTTEDKDASYPDCCPEVVCPDSSEVDYNNPFTNEVNSGDNGQRNATDIQQDLRRQVSNQLLRQNDQEQWDDEQEQLQSLDSENEIEDEDFYTRKASPRLFYLY